MTTRDDAEIIMDRASLQQMIDNAIAAERERCANIAANHSARRDRHQRGKTFNPMPEEAILEIQAEERGEDIAAAEIAKAIRQPI